MDVRVPDQRLFKYTDDNVLIRQLLAPLEIGHEVYTAAKARIFCGPVLK